MFQSLFCWKLLWKLAKIDPEDDIFLFQSLFCWKLLWKFLIINCFHLLRKLVSILILLEIALEAFRYDYLHWAQLRFNPYSAGNCSGRVTKAFEIREQQRFNPYSAGNCSGRMYAHSSQFFLASKFQSLFCWKLLWKLVDFLPRSRTT